MVSAPAPRLSASPVWRAGLLLAALGLGFLAGCPFELPRGLSCGDGWWDPQFEACDPRDPARAYIDACRDDGFDVDATCDPQTCTIQCDVCGDGVASSTEQCDGNDLHGNSCVVGTLRCNADCTFDYSDCPPVCGDDIVNGDEECEAELVCAGNDDCAAGMTCYQGNCIVIGENFLPNLSCSDYATTAVGINKPYASGTIGACVKDGCYFGRNDCSFCGDGELDGPYDDLTAPGGKSSFPAEVCDGDQFDRNALEAHCKSVCDGEQPFNADVVALCDYECRADCSDFAATGDVLPGQDPEDFGCCLAEDSPCPNFDVEGVPEYPCCSWFDNPKWMEAKKCVLADTGTLPMKWVCP